MKRRELSFSSMDEVLADLDRLHSQGYDRVGGWNLGQNCDHLEFFMIGTVDGFKFKVPWLLKTLFGRMVLRRILSQKQMKTGIPTPQKPLPPPGANEAAAVARLQNTIRRFQSHVGEYHPSPFFGAMTRDEWLQLQLIHCAHHLSHLLPK